MNININEQTTETESDNHFRKNYEVYAYPSYTNLTIIMTQKSKKNITPTDSTEPEPYITSLDPGASVA